MKLSSNTQCHKFETRLQSQRNHQVQIHYFLEIKFITVKKIFVRNIKEVIFPCRYPNTL